MMLYAASVLCLLYFAVIVFYSGFSTDFIIIWPVLAVMFAAAGSTGRMIRKQKSGMPRPLPYFIRTTFYLGAVVFFVLLMFILSESGTGSAPGCDYVIVMGGRVYDDGISSTLKKRLDTAISYGKKNPDTVFVLSGGQEGDTPVPEALAMYNYMVLNGADEKKLLIEAESRSTTENIRNSKLVIDEDLKQRMIPPPLTIGICTSDYHLMRSELVAGKFIEDKVYCIPAPSDRILFMHLCVRECFAVVKDRLMGNL